MDLGLFVGHEIPVHAAIEPHGVGVEIGHHHADRDVQELPFSQIDQDLRRKKVGADGQARILFPEKLDEGTRVEPVEDESPFFELPGAV